MLLVYIFSLTEICCSNVHIFTCAHFSNLCIVLCIVSFPPNSITNVWFLRQEVLHSFASLSLLFSYLVVSDSSWPHGPEHTRLGRCKMHISLQKFKSNNFPSSLFMCDFLCRAGPKKICVCVLFKITSLRNEFYREHVLYFTVLTHLFFLKSFSSIKNMILRRYSQFGILLPAGTQIWW